MELRYVDDVHSDIEFTTAHLAIHMSAPTVALQKEANQLLSYLAGTTRHSLRIAPTSNQVHAYCDASYVIHPGIRRHFGVAQFLGDQGYCSHTKSSAIE